MTRIYSGWIAFTALVLTTALAAAHTPNQPPHQLYKMGDLKLESGEAIKDFAISYVTHGTLNAKKSNAILMVTAISGNHHRLDFMIGPGNARHRQVFHHRHRMQFPKFLIRDMVTSQHRLLGGAIPADVAFINRETTTFLDQVTEGGKKLD
jgi:homoserine O-acetyltransferase/O-succinyltransferase